MQGNKVVSLCGAHVEYVRHLTEPQPTELERAISKVFNLVCRCGSTQVEVDSTVGYSNLSGMWGGVSLRCLACGATAEIWDTDH